MNKLKQLFTYNEKFGCIEQNQLDFRINAHYDGHSWTIEYIFDELDISPKHIHCSSLNEGIKEIVHDIIEHAIWKLND